MALPVPTPEQRAWQQAEIGVLYHFDISTAVGDYSADNNSSKKVYDPTLYDPKDLDTDQWVAAAKAAGATYAIFTATHFNGFSQWQSDAYPYGLKQAAWRDGQGDIVGDFVASCHRYGIKPGLYMSTHRNAWWRVDKHYVDNGAGRGTPEQDQYNRAAEAQFTELCSNYGELFQIWMDAGTKTVEQGGPDLLPIWDKHQPGGIFYHSIDRAESRWVGNEEGYAGYPCWATMPGGEQSHNAESWKNILANGDPNGTTWSPAIVDLPLRGTNGVHNWFWWPNQDHGVYSPERLARMHTESVGRNSNLIFGATINPDGRVPDADVAALTGFGDIIKRRYTRSLGKTRGHGTEIELELWRDQPVRRITFGEAIEHGERIRRYEIDAKIDSTWQLVRSGQSVGHKRIEEFEPFTCSALRLRITESRAEPEITQFSAYGDK